jgi:hypothetical protein
VEKAFDFVDSPLSVRLSKQLDATVYAKAAVHLFRVVRGENKSLRLLSQDDAWETISRQPGNTTTFGSFRQPRNSRWLASSIANGNWLPALLTG